MFKFTVKIGKFSENDGSKAESIRSIVDDILKKPLMKHEEQFKEKLNLELNVLLGNGNFRCSVATMYWMETPNQKSYFISIFGEDLKPVLLTAEYVDLSSLKDLAAWEISKKAKDVEKLIGELPKTLVSEVKKFL